MVTTLELDWPPSVNSYWRHVPGKRGETRVLISAAGRKYRHAVAEAVLLTKGRKHHGDARIQLHITATPPDRVRRDLDNLLKAPLDALEHAGVYDNDGQIDDLRITRTAPSKPGRLVVTIISPDEEEASGA